MNLEPTLILGTNRVIRLSIRRRNQWSLTDINGRNQIGKDIREDDLPTDDLNWAFVYFMCSIYESFLESLLLDYIINRIPKEEPLHKSMFSEIRKLSSLGKYSDFHQRLYGSRIDYSDSITALFDLRNFGIHGSTRIIDVAWRNTLESIPDLKNLHNYIITKFSFCDDSDFDYCKVMNCNVVFNNLYCDMLDDMMIKAPKYTMPIMGVYSDKLFVAMADGWKATYLSNCGGLR